MPALLLRAIVTGFGYKIGAELGRIVAERFGLKKEEAKKDEEDSGFPHGMSSGSGDEPPDDDIDDTDDADADAVN